MRNAAGSGAGRGGRLANRPLRRHANETLAGNARALRLAANRLQQFRRRGRGYSSNLSAPPATLRGAMLASGVFAASPESLKRLTMG